MSLLDHLLHWLFQQFVLLFFSVFDLLNLLLVKRVMGYLGLQKVLLEGFFCKYLGKVSILNSPIGHLPEHMLHTVHFVLIVGKTLKEYWQ